MLLPSLSLSILKYFSITFCGHAHYHRVCHYLWCGGLGRYACILCGSDSVIERQRGSWPTRSSDSGVGLWVYPHIHLWCMDRLADKGAMKNSIEQVIAADSPKIGLPLNFSLPPRCARRQRRSSSLAVQLFIGAVTHRSLGACK